MRRTDISMGLVGLGIAVICGLARLNAGTLAELEKTIANGRANPALVARLRASGPTGLEELFEFRKQLQSAAGSKPDAARLAALNERLDRLDSVIDQVGMQRYCSRSRLYWYTDLEEAKRAGRTSGKPILSLRMLGKLDEDFSCANSRFFRTTLYANQEVSDLLRDQFVLHWKSVRPVPKVTVDFGDGRKLERTLTGNSIHYVLTPDGEVVDAVPGLYGPKAFAQQVYRGLIVAKRIVSLPPTGQRQELAAFHQAEINKLAADWQSDFVRAGGQPELAVLEHDASKSQAATASVATAIALPKARIESDLVRSAVPLAADPMKLEDENLWQAIAALHAEDATLDSASRELIRSENPTAAQAAPVAVTKLVVEDPLVRLVRSLESSIAVDTVKNEYRLHREIHRWLSEPSDQPDVESLNERVYAELFLTPSSDPWLGLAPADVYTALPNAGVVRK